MVSRDHLQALPGGRRVSASEEETSLEHPMLAYNAQMWDLASPHYKLDQAIIATIEFWGEEYVATIPDLNVYGSGTSPALALHSLKGAIIDFLEVFRESDPEQTGDPLGRILATLRALVREVA